MMLKQVWDRMTRDGDPGIEFEEFEELLNDWAWEELTRQREGATGNIYKPERDLPVDGF